MSAVFVFAAIWVAVLFTLVVLDWWGNPNRGPFRPQSESDARRTGSRRERRRLRRAREDTAVRSVLRDRYGRSSLRLQWSDDQEGNAVRVDEDTVTMSRSAAGLDRYAGAASTVILDPAVESGPPDEPDEPDEPEAEPEQEHEAEAEPEQEADQDPEQEAAADSGPDEPDDVAVPMMAVPPPARMVSGWRAGDDPLAPTRSGAPPPAATVRSRVWKSRAGDGAWDETCRQRLRGGNPPQRRNPLTGRTEFATVDTETGRPEWPEPAVDPFAPESS